MNAKKLLVVFLILVCSLALVTACTAKPTEPTEPVDPASPTEPTEPTEPVKELYITFGGGSSGGAAFTQMASIASMVEKYVPGVTATAEVTTATIENCRRVAAEEMEFGFATLDGAYEAYNGLGSFEEPLDNLRYVLKGSESSMQIVTAAKSNIYTISDMKGKKIGVLSGITAQGDWPKVLEFYGMTNADYQETALTHQELADQLKDGIIDAYVVFAAYPVSSISDLATSVDLRYISIEEDVIAQFVEKYPYFLAGSVPAGPYKGQDEDIVTILRSAGMITHANVDEDLVYEVVKATYEHNEELVAIYSDFQYWSIDSAGQFCLIPPHPGLVKYLEEQGIKIDKRY